MTKTKEATKEVERRQEPSVDLSQRLVGRLAHKYGVPAQTLMKTLRDTVFNPGKDKHGKPHPPFTDEEIAAALILAEQYELNPFAKEIYVTRSRGRLLVIVPIDGWVKIVNRQPDFDGVKFHFDWKDDKREKIHSITCEMHLKSRSHPVIVTEYFDECFQSTKEPWQKWPVRMLRHKAFNQAARLAYGLAGIMDDDEADRMRHLGTIRAEATPGTPEPKYLAGGSDETEDLDEVREVKDKPARAGGPEAPELIEKVRAALARLSEEKRQVAVRELGDFEGLSDTGRLADALEYVEGL